MSLLPNLETPSISRARAPLRGSSLDQLDAVMIMAPQSVTAKTLARLPAAQRWQELHARDKAAAGQVRITALANKRQSTAVLGYLRQGATTFEHLALAGKMIKEAHARQPQSIGLVSLLDENEASSEALLAATLAQAFALPTFRSSRAFAKSMKRIVMAHDSGIDLAPSIAAARGNNLARWLTALPPNKLDARAYRALITELAKRHSLKMRWLDERELQRLGANAFLAVSAGNAERVAGIAHLEYRPESARRSAPVDLALIGKGILFDTGGTNLKTHRSMLDMHIDMSGSAVALASLLALCELRVPINTDAWLAITENRTGPTAYKPQDVVTAANGVTIQVIHTDAEGRMALADTLALAGRTKPRMMIDYATLTGTCLYALTERMSGVFTNRPQLIDPLLAAGQSSGERVWNFPFDEDYDSDLESKVADIMQCAVEGKGDQILAARFLNRFVPEDIPWAHIDLSAAIRSGGLGHVNTDITGFGVRYTLDLLLKQNILDKVRPNA